MPAGVGQGEGQGEIGEEEEKNLLKAFEEIQYLIEDLDHANSRTTICSGTCIIRTHRLTGQP